jgi:hypothetical protein
MSTENLGETHQMYVIIRNCVFTLIYTIFRCVVLTNMCVYVPSNTTVILDGVLFALSYMFRLLLGHLQAILEVCYL